MTILELLDLAIESRIPLIEVTGGEPLIQDDTFKLLKVLSDSFQVVLLETSGAYSVEAVDPRVHVVMDVKCPGSGMVDTFHLDNLRLLENRPHELKFVISSKADFDWVCGFVSENGLKNRELIVSPSFGEVSLREISNWVLDGPHMFRVQTQLHKLIWPDGEKEL
jgi:7-carboxy-7-deazaguanine synthase